MKVNKPSKPLSIALCTLVFSVGFTFLVAYASLEPALAWVSIVLTPLSLVSIVIIYGIEHGMLGDKEKAEA